MCLHVGGREMLTYDNEGRPFRKITFRKILKG